MGAVRSQPRIFLLCFLPGRLFCFLGPIGQHFISELANLFHGARFRFLSGAAFGHGLIDQVRNAEQASAQVRTVRETLIQTLLRGLPAARAVSCQSRPARFKLPRVAPSRQSTAALGLAQHRRTSLPYNSFAVR